jgi:hypothetical protein
MLCEKIPLRRERHTAGWGTEEHKVAGHVLTDAAGGALGAVELDSRDAVVLVPSDDDSTVGVGVPQWGPMGARDVRRSEAAPHAAWDESPRH